ncbi:MAG: RNB domain-containing ribonuclease, partial [Rubrivivax sp.]
NYLKALGIGLSVSDEPRPAEMQSVAEATRDRPDAAQIHQMLLRSMQQAVYTPTNSGHFGLAFDAYTHFTSPIRRYPDLLVHRVIKALLTGKTYRLAPSALRMPPQPRRSLAPKATPQQQRALDKQSLAWQAAGLHTSASERRADEASRDVEAWLKCRFMRDRLGEEFQGTVSSVVGFGLFVTLDQLHVEGLVHVTELGGEYFRFDELRQELRGDRSGMRYGVGTRVRVQVSRVDLDGRRIDFRMVREPASPWAGNRSRTVAPEGAESGSAVELLGATQAQDRAVKAKAVNARKGRVTADSAARKSGDRRAAGKSKTGQAGKRGRR